MARSPSPTPSGGRSHSPSRYVAQPVELGWAVTGYDNQGDTVDVGIAVPEPGTNRSHAYVAVTRGRHAYFALIPDATGTSELAEELAEMISRSPRHESALEVRARLDQEAAVPEPPLDPPLVPPITDDQAAKVRAIRQRPDALQTPSSGRGPGL